MSSHSNETNDTNLNIPYKSSFKKEKEEKTIEKQEIFLLDVGSFQTWTTLIKKQAWLVRDWQWKTIKSWQHSADFASHPIEDRFCLKKAPTRNDACLTKQLNYLKIITIRRFWEEAKNNSVLPSTFFQNFQCCNNGFRFGIRVEDDTIMTFWVYWLVKSLTCFNVHIYALSIYYKILFIILLLYIRHSFFLVKGKGKRSV